jgi:hypothetical protein
MSTRNEFLNILMSYGPNLPVVIVWIVGIIFALTRWKRHPKISLLTFLALGGQLILFLVNAVLNIYASRVLFGAWNSEQISSFYTVKYSIMSLIEAGLWIMLLYAIFSMRGEQKRLEGNYGRPPAPMSA